MKFVKTTLPGITILLFVSISLFAAESSLVDFVNPMIGTDSKFEFSNGNTYPAITMPFGMTEWAPQTGSGRWIYQYGVKSFQGIRATHQPSVWIGDYGDFSIMPITGSLQLSAENRASSFSHDNETARPYYYSVKLDRYNIRAELAPTMRCAYLRFTFPYSEQSKIIIDTHKGGGYVKILPEKNMVIGYSTSNNGGVPENFACYFAISVDAKFSGYGIWRGGKAFKAYGRFQEEDGDHTGCYLEFQTGADESIGLKVGTSFISIEQAQKNLKNEIGGKNFDDIKDEAKDTWNKELNKITIEGCTQDQKTTFYSAYYRTLLYPRV